MGAGPLRAFDMMVYDTSKVLKLIQFDISNPIEKDTPGIIIESLVSLECDAGDPFSNMLATSHFLAYARAPRPLEQDTGPIYLESFLGGFHTWLTLPSVFGRNTSIADMASKGDYLAVTTSGGGALVWEIPKPTGQVQFFRPIIRLQILPETPGLKKVKWHSIGTVGFASSNQVYLLDLHEVQVTFGGLPVVLDKLKYVARVFEVLPPVISFGFDYRSDSVAILSFGGSISFFVIHGHYRIWKATIQGPGQPYSLDIYDWGMLVGWKQGSVFQLFTPFSTNIISTFQFTDSTDLVAKTNAESHTCLCYDSQIRVLWVAHSARSSILAVHIPVEADNPRPESIHMNAYQVFEQIVEIPTPTPITGISLAASADGLAVVNVYVTNASGVDRIIFNQDALESSHIMRNLTVGTLLEERSQTEVPNSSYPATRLDYLGHQIGATPPEVNQPKISTLHSVRVNWDGKEDIIAKKRPENIVEFDVSYEHDSIKAKADCITITPLAQLTANSIGNQFPELLAFDHGHVPGPIFTVNAFLAYGMANGRIGLVFRHNGAQAILKLPAVYGRSASAVDLTIINNYLACITDSGGAIVWNIPNTYSQRSGASHAPLLQIQPSGLRKAKWRHEGSLALMSDSEVCLLDILQLQATFEGLYVPWKNLLQFIQRYSVPSFIVNFTFDTKNTTLATISIDSVISLWSMETPQIIWQGRIPGKGEPSSIILMDNGVLIGRNRGTTIQLFAPRSIDVLSTFRFVHSRDPVVADARMHSHLCYDSRSQTLWTVNSRRSSLIALRVLVHLENPDIDTEGAHGMFEKIAEFPMPVPIDGLVFLSHVGAHDPLLAVVTTASHVTRVDLMTIKQSIFENSLRMLSTNLPSKIQVNDIQDEISCLNDDKPRRFSDLQAVYQHSEVEDQRASPPANTVSISSSYGTKVTNLMDIARPKEMSTDEMFKCLIFHGCPNLTESMDPDAYSKGFVIAGGFGDIWKGKLCDGTTVAIKVWRFRTLNEDVGKDIKRAMREIYNWSKLDHDNIHKLLGVVVFDGRLGMVSKWMEKGNLQHYLQKNPLTDRYPLCIQVARGVEYLHKKNMIHGDLKAINILVSSDHGLKLTDFDHSIMSECTLQFSETTRMGGGTLRWMAPELVLDSEAIHQRNKKTDIYALGMVSQETITGTVPYSQQCRTDINIYHTLTKKEFPRRDPIFFGSDQRGNRMWALLMRCWDHDPASRPIASEVTALLQTLVRETEPRDTT
ncbi:hypothetical protein ACGC1H_005367 [Rhizoctonia solani]